MVKALIQWFYNWRGPNKLKVVALNFLMAEFWSRAKELSAQSGEPRLSLTLLAIASVPFVALVLWSLVREAKTNQRSWGKTAIFALVLLAVFGGAWKQYNLYEVVQASSDAAVTIALYLTVAGLVCIWDMYKVGHRHVVVKHPKFLARLDRDKTGEGLGRPLRGRGLKRFQRKNAAESGGATREGKSRRRPAPAEDGDLGGLDELLDA